MKLAQQILAKFEAYLNPFQLAKMDDEALLQMARILAKRKKVGWGNMKDKSMFDNIIKLLGERGISPKGLMV